MTEYTEPTACDSGEPRTRFTQTDLDNLASLVNGGGVEERRYLVSAVADWLREHRDMTTAEAVVELLHQIRNG